MVAALRSMIAICACLTLLTSGAAAVLCVAHPPTGGGEDRLDAAQRALLLDLTLMSALAGVLLLAWVIPTLSRDAGRLRAAIQALVDDLEMPSIRMHSREFDECARQLSGAAEQLRARRAALQDNAFRDALTGLPNRRPFMDNLIREASTAIRSGRPLSLVMADLDHFKSLNDTHGHQLGDRVLRHVAGRFSSLVRQSDMVARFGGEEFAILLPGADMPTALEITHQLRNALRSAPVVLDGEHLQISSSFGVAEMLECGLSEPDHLLHHADMALYEAKRQGRDRVVAAPPSEVGQPASQVADILAVAGGPPASEHQAKSAKEKAFGEASLDQDTLALMGCTFSMLQVMPDKHRVVRDMIQQVASVLQCERVSVLLANPERTSLVPVAALGVPDFAKASPIPVPHDLRQWFADLSGCTQDPPADLRGPVCINSEAEDGGNRVLYLPVAEYDDILGVIVATDLPDGAELTARQKTILGAISAIGASALKSCDVYSRLERHWVGSIEGLCGAIATGYAGRPDHLTRVSTMCQQIARLLGQEDKEELQFLQLAAHLYDIGKIGVPRNLLEKKGPLRAGELALIRDHCRLGAAIVGSLPGLERLGQVVLHHHEHIDGNGYPEGLSGEAIPLESRIISVVDAYEAMTSERPYRRPISPRKAIDTLLAAAGTQFDLKVVKAFLRIPHIAAIREGPISSDRSAPQGDLAAATASP